ncbi:Chitinase 4 [Acorus calamus]|uniref:chitinase n=1 Tax=Acorus calamus TaxID=4465 RepID=A0AAV9D502_ACOCL|nr:Chitinase 4 [Acorus calamus]
MASLGKASGSTTWECSRRWLGTRSYRFKTVLWFWMNNIHSIITSGKGFGEMIRVINGDLESNGKNPGTIQSRVGYYQDYCGQMGVPPGGNMYC